MTKSSFVILIIIKKNRTFNRFLAIRKQTSAGEIIFSNLNLIDMLNKFEDKYYKIGHESTQSSRIM